MFDIEMRCFPEVVGKSEDPHPNSVYTDISFLAHCQTYLIPCPWVSFYENTVFDSADSGI